MASKLSPLIPLAPAIWSRWKGRARMPLWQAAALSAGFEPVYRLQSGNFAAASLAAENGLAIEAERYTETPLLKRLRCDMDFSTRLALLTDRLGGAEMDEAHPVKIADVLAVALDMGWSVPDEFKVLAGGGTAPSTSASPAACHEAVAVPAAPEAPDIASAPAVVHRVGNRAHPLDGVIAEARRRAVRDDWLTVWGELTRMAERPDRPAPLMGYAPGDGLKVQSDDPEGFRCHSREAFRKLWGRRNKG